MPRAISIEVPFKLDGNRRYLDRFVIEDDAVAAAFYLRFKHRFQYDYLHDRAYLIEDDDGESK